MSMIKYFVKDDVTHIWREDPNSGATVRFGGDGDPSLERSARRHGIPLGLLKQAFGFDSDYIPPQPAPVAEAPAAPRKSKKAKRREQEDAAAGGAGDAAVIAATAAAASTDSADDGGEF